MRRILIFDCTVPVLVDYAIDIGATVPLSAFNGPLIDIQPARLEPMFDLRIEPRRDRLGPRRDWEQRDKRRRKR